MPMRNISGCMFFISVSRFKNGKEIMADDRFKMVRDETFYMLKIRRVERKDKGVYKCQVSWWTRSHSLSLSVCLPVFHSLPSAQDSRILCIYSRKPHADYSSSARHLLCSGQRLYSGLYTWSCTGQDTVVHCSRVHDIYKCILITTDHLIPDDELDIIILWSVKTDASLPFPNGLK